MCINNFGRMGRLGCFRWGRCYRLCSGRGRAESRCNRGRRYKLRASRAGPILLADTNGIDAHLVGACAICATIFILEAVRSTESWIAQTDWWALGAVTVLVDSAGWVALRAVSLNERSVTGELVSFHDHVVDAVVELVSEVDQLWEECQAAISGSRLVVGGGNRRDSRRPIRAGNRRQIVVRNCRPVHHSSNSACYEPSVVGVDCPLAERKDARQIVRFVTVPRTAESASFSESESSSDQSDFHIGGEVSCFERQTVVGFNDQSEESGRRDQ